MIPWQLYIWWQYEDTILLLNYQLNRHWGPPQIAHLGWATSGPPAPVAATVGPPVAHPPHRWRAIWIVDRSPTCVYWYPLNEMDPYNANFMTWEYLYRHSADFKYFPHSWFWSYNFNFCNSCTTGPFCSRHKQILYRACFICRIVLTWEVSLLGPLTSPLVTDWRNKCPQCVFWYN